MTLFNYHHLYYFYCIAEQGTVTRASQLLRISQPALSSQLKQFESFLGKPLFKRQGKQLILTEEGHFVLGYAKSIFDLGNEMLDGLQDRSLQGKMRIQIGVSTTVPKAVTQALIQYVFQLKPRPHLIIKEGQTRSLIKELDVHALDLVLSDSPEQTSTSSSIQNHLLAKIPVVFCTHRTLAKHYAKIPHSLKEAPIILPTAQSQIYHALQTYFLSHQIAPEIIAEVGDVELVRRMVLDKTGVAPINRFTVLKAPANKDLVILNPKGTPGIFDTIYLIEKKRQVSNPIASEIIKKFKINHQVVTQTS